MEIIQNKYCYKCKSLKSLNEFSKSSREKDGFQQKCKQCDKSYSNKNRKRTDEEIKEYQEQNLNNKKICTKCKKTKTLKDFHKHRKNKSGVSDRCIDCMLQYMKNNKNRIIKTNRKYINNRRMVDIEFKIRTNLRSRLKTALKNMYKTGSAIKDLGCSIGELKKYVERKFYRNTETNEPMSWENYGFYGWHLDHIKPLSSFNLTDRKQFLEACHYTNLQPMWAKENLAKGKKYHE